jgi:hypothetical protein
MKRVFIALAVSWGLVATIALAQQSGKQVSGSQGTMGGMMHGQKQGQNSGSMQGMMTMMKKMMDQCNAMMGSGMMSGMKDKPVTPQKERTDK